MAIPSLIGASLLREVIVRHDHTEWLIHFARDRDPGLDVPDESDGVELVCAGGEIPPEASAFEVLKTIIRLGGLISGYSFRNGRTTIYGGKPAVCVTEMPLYSFAEYAQSSSPSKMVSAYGIAVLKTEFFDAGGRPVIYGLSTDAISYEQNTPTCRVLSSDILPPHEQYRYVAYNPTRSTKSKWVDWSHEREWRWVARDQDIHGIHCRTGAGKYDWQPGLPLFGGTEGGHFSKVCIIVWTHAEAREIQELLTGLYLAGSNDYDTAFDRVVIDNSSIVVLSEVVDAVESQRELDAQTIEGLGRAMLLRPVVIFSPPQDAELRVTRAISEASRAGAEAATQYAERYGLSDGGLVGFASAVTTEVLNPLVQYMIKTGKASGPYNGRVDIDVPRTWCDMQSIDYNEHVYTAIAKSLSSSLGVAVEMTSRLD